MSNTYYNDIEQFQIWQQMWDQAQNNMPAPVSPQENDDEEDAIQLVEELRSSASQHLDLRDMLILSKDIDRVFHPERFDEAKDIEVIKAAQKSAASPNPVQITSIGKDQDVVVSKDWTYGPVISQIAEMKIKLEALERRAHTANLNGNDRQESSINRELANLRTKVEELCEKLTPHMITNPS